MKRFRVKTKTDNNSNSCNDEYNVQNILLYVLFFVLTVITISNKAYYYSDELASYLLANNKTTIREISPGLTIAVPRMPEVGVRAVPATQHLDYTLSPTSDDRFDYKSVWVNQAQDTHPPLYYVLLHTICSFFPGRFSKWFAGIINIVFALATLFAVRRLIRLFTDSDFILTAVSLFFILSPATLNLTAFLRMYIMAMFWITLQTYFLVLNAKQIPDDCFYCKIFFVTLFGTLTHYYCTLYFAFSSAIFSIYLLRDKKYGALCKFCAASLCALAVAYSIFPAMAKHLFHGARGVQFLSNITFTTDCCYHITSSFNSINKEFFAYALPLFPLLLLLCFIYRKMKSANKFGDCPKNAACEIKTHLREYCLILVPLTLFLLTTAKTAPLILEQERIRYFVPAYALLLTVILLLTFSKLKRCGIVLLSVLLLLHSWIYTDWNGAWLYRRYLKNELAEQYKNADCVLVGCLGNSCLYELSRYKSLTWLTTDMIQQKSAQFKALISQNKLVVGILFPKQITPEQANSLIYSLIEHNGQISQYSIIRTPYYRDYMTQSFSQQQSSSSHGYIYYLERRH